MFGYLQKSFVRPCVSPWLSRGQGTGHTSSQLSYHNPKGQVLPLFLFSRLSCPFDCSPLPLTCMFIPTSVRFVESLVFAASTRYGWVNSGNLELQPSHPAALGCATEHFSMHFGFSWWQKEITVPVSTVRIKIFFASMTATLGWACGHLPAVQGFSKFSGHFIAGWFCRPRIHWQTFLSFKFFIFKFMLGVFCSQRCAGWIEKI